MRRPMLLVLTFLANVAIAQVPAERDFDARLKHLETELRCLVCQNQTLADSNAPLAEDLRREVRELAKSGKSDGEIKQYLVARYGDFVLYRPPLQSNTWILWVGPFVLLIGGGAIWYLIVRRRKGRNDNDESLGSEISPEEAVAQAKQMLYEEP